MSRKARFYTDADLQKALNLDKPKQSTKKTVIYTRVSTHPQKADLLRQQERLELFCAGRGLVVDEKLSDLGSGLNFKRKNLDRLMQQVRFEQVGTIVVAYKDRLCRFGFDFIEEFCSWYGCEVLIADREDGSPEQELVSDLLAIVHCFSSKSYSLRRKKTKLDEIIEKT